MLSLTAPVTLLHPLQHCRSAAEALDRPLYSVRAGELVRAERACGAGRWSCRRLCCGDDPRGRVELTGADLATALAPAALTGSGHPDPHEHLVAFRVAWTSRAWQRCGSRAGTVASLLASDVGRDLVVDLDPALTRARAVRVHVLPDGFDRLVRRLATAALLSVNSSEPYGLLTLPPAAVPVLT